MLTPERAREVIEKAAQEDLSWLDKVAKEQAEYYNTTVEKLSQAIDELAEVEEEKNND